MKKLHVAALSVFFFITMRGGAQTQAQEDLQSPLWGNLSAGSYAVGFKTLYQFDRTRTWRTTHGTEKPFAPDLNGRPIRISIWYPAIRD